MPFRSIQGTTDATFLSLTLQLPSEGHILYAVSAYEPLSQRGTDELFTQIFLASTSMPTPTPQILLCSGYFGAQGMVGWTGRIPLDADSLIIGRFRSIIQTTITLAIYTGD